MLPLLCGVNPTHAQLLGVLGWRMDISLEPLSHVIYTLYFKRPVIQESAK
jgi:hypothetical protein